MFSFELRELDRVVAELVPCLRRARFAGGIDEALLAQEIRVEVEDAQIAGNGDAIQARLRVRARRAVGRFVDGEGVILRQVDPILVRPRLLVDLLASYPLVSVGECQ